MMKPKFFVPIYIISDIWQNVGWGSIIYLAALASIEVELYESAVIDGASRLQKIRYINIPGILPTVVVLFILQTGSIMNVSFEKVFLLQNTSILETADVISTYIYRVGIQGSEFSLSSAVGLFNSLVNFIILLTVNSIARKFGDTSLW
jgi:putative aldouronate transport system permease protein